MSENRHSVLTTSQPLHIAGADAFLFEEDVSAKPAVAHGKRILIVEDQEPVRKALRMLLELDEHQVTEAGNGLEAMNLFRTGAFDLVITDFEMPVMKGNELALSLKLLAPELPILMVTASEGAHSGAENPVDAFLDKPFTWRDLRSALEKVLSPRPAALASGSLSR